MDHERRWQDEQGSYMLVARENFIEARIIGKISEESGEQFFNDVLSLAKHYTGRPFGYLSDLRLSEGFDELPEENLIDVYKTFSALGCVVDAVVYQSPEVKQRMKQFDDILDISIPLELRLFEDRSKAVSFIEKFVRKSKDT